MYNEAFVRKVKCSMEGQGVARRQQARWTKRTEESWRELGRWKWRLQRGNVWPGNICAVAILPPSKASEQEIDWFPASWYRVRKVPTPSFVYWPSVMGSCPSILGIVLGGRRRWWRFVSCRHHLCLVRARHCRLLLRREQDLYSIRHYNHSCCHYLASIVGLRAYHLYTHTSQTVVAISAPLTDV